MVMCFKSAEALVAMLFGDEPASYEWFPDTFKLTSNRLRGGNWTARFSATTPQQMLHKILKLKQDMGD
jgi:hypothetical protein